jgi:hypothetical protein
LTQLGRSTAWAYAAKALTFRLSILGGRIDMKRHEFIRLIGGAGGGLAQYRALIAEWKDGKCWSAVSAD